MSWVETTHSFRYLLSIVGLFAVFFIRLYEGGLLSALLLHGEKTPFANLAELAGTPSIPAHTDLVAGCRLCGGGEGPAGGGGLLCTGGPPTGP